LQSALIPVALLFLLAAGAMALVMGQPLIALMCWLVALIPASIKAAMMLRRRLQRGVVAAAQALTVAVVFDLARALALLGRASHRARRVA
jgi:hypothetical protein